MVRCSSGGGRPTGSAERPGAAGDRRILRPAGPRPCRLSGCARPRPAPLPTTSPMTPTTSTTGCAPTCSPSRSCRGAADRRHPGRHRRRLSAARTGARRSHELVRRLITRMIEDVIAESRRRLGALGPRSADDIRRAGAPVVAFSPTMARPTAPSRRSCSRACTAIRGSCAIMGEAEAVVGDLFGVICDAPANCRGRACGGLAARPPSRRLYRRHDRPLRALRACAAF